MSGPYKAGSEQFNTAILERLVRVEAGLAAVKEDVEAAVRYQTAAEAEMRDAIAANAKVLEQKIDANKESLEAKIDKTNSSLASTNELLSKINSKLSIHTFVFGALSTLGLAGITAFLGGLAKSLFDSVFSRH
jgi:uncharacterized protein YlxW (UPF0749 family)